MVDRSVFETFTAALGQTGVSKAEITSYLDAQASELDAIIADGASSSAEVLEMAQELCVVARNHGLDDLVARFETIAERAAA